MSNAPEPVDAGGDVKPRAGDASARRAASDVVLQIVARVLNALLGVAVTIVLVRGLEAQGFGEWSTLQSIVTIVGYLGILGLNEVAVRHAAMDPAHESVWISALFSLMLIISVPVTVIALAVGVAITHSTAAHIAAILLSLTCLVNAIGSVRVVFQLRVRNSWTAGFELANGILWAIGVFVVAAVGGGLVAFAAAFLAALAIVTIIQFVIALPQFELRLRGGGHARRELIVMGVPFAIASLLYLGYTQVDQVLVFQLAGAREAGLFGVANRVLDRALVIPASILATLFPMLAAAYGMDMARLRALVQTATEVLLTATLPLVCLVAVIATPLLRLMFGPQFAAAGPALAILMIVYAISAFSYMAGDLVIVLRMQRRYIAYAVAGLIANVGLNVLLIPRYGFIAAAWVNVVSEALVISLALHSALKLIGQRLRVGRMLRITLVSAAGGGAALAARTAGLPLIPIGVVWLAATAAAWLLIRPWTVGELRTLLQRRDAG